MFFRSGQVIIFSITNFGIFLTQKFLRSSPSAHYPGKPYMKWLSFVTLFKIVSCRTFILWIGPADPKDLLGNIDDLSDDEENENAEGTSQEDNDRPDLVISWSFN